MKRSQSRKTTRLESEVISLKVYSCKYTQKNHKQKRETLNFRISHLGSGRRTNIPDFLKVVSLLQGPLLPISFYSFLIYGAILAHDIFIIFAKISAMTTHPNKPLDFEPFDGRCITEYDEHLVEYSIERAELYIQHQQDNLTEIDNKSTTILGWLIAGISALIGYVAVYTTSNLDNWRLLAIALTSLLFLSVAASVLMKSNLYKRSSHFSGAGPSIFFHQDVREWVETHYPDETPKMIKINYLQVLQNRIIYNAGETVHRVKHYRICLYVICAGILSVLTLSCVFFIA